MERQLTSAANALKRKREEWTEARANPLLDTSVTIQLLVSVVNNQQLTPTIKTHRVRLPVPLFPLDKTDICLITRPPQRRVKDLLAKGTFPHRIERVIDTLKLKRKFKTYNQRSQLHRSYSLFLVDKTMVRSLPAILGGEFMYTAKMPIPVEIHRNADKLKKELQKGVATTMFHSQQKSIETTINVGRTDMDGSAIARNALKVIAYLKTCPGFDGNIHAIRMKTQHTPALLVYQRKAEDAEQTKEA
jgi:ribosome biogenesis protein UTP30